MQLERIKIYDQQTGRSLDPFNNVDPVLASLKTSTINCRAAFERQERALALALAATLRELARSPLVREFQGVLGAMNASVFLSDWKVNTSNQHAGFFSPLHFHSYYLCLILTPSGFRVGGSNSIYLEYCPSRYRFGFSRQLTRSLVRIGVTPHEVREELLGQIEYVKQLVPALYDPSRLEKNPP